MSESSVDRFSRLSQIISDAPEPDDPEALSHWLDAACGDDAWLRTQAAELLEHRRDMPSEFLVAASEARAERPVPDRIGPFTVTGRLGHGGMGEVFVGHDPAAARDVAIKVVIGGRSSDEVLARFEAERRMLARMDHPGIARVWSVGRTEEGQPWLAMELIPGATDIVQHARDRGLGLRERVELMAQVCDAVHHAHQKGVVHRDLKPGNIVVADQESAANPRPRVIDFGVARLVDEAARLDFRTRAGQMIGTRAYMAPEQARDPGAADVRSDVFALGAVLYELITDRRAFTSAGGPAATPPMAVAGPFAVPPDLDLIVRTAIAEDPAIRYGSAEALAADLRRQLRNVPIAARPPTAAYVIRKFVRRHRATVGVSVAAVAALVLATVLATDQAIRATRAESETRRFASRAGLVAAAGAIRDHDAVAAAAFLDASPGAIRGWEWRHLDRQARGYRRQVLELGVPAEAIARDAAGRVVVQPTVARDVVGTDPPVVREGILLLGGGGLEVQGRRAVTWGRQQIRVTETTDARSLAVLHTPFTVLAATMRGDEVIALGTDGILRRSALSPVAWTTFGPALPARSSRTRVSADDDDGLIVRWPEGFVRLVGDELRREVRFPADATPAATAISDDGRRLAVCRRDGSIVIHDTRTGTVLQNIDGLPAPGIVVAFDGSGERLVVGGRDEALYLVDLAAGTIVGPPRLGHAGMITAVGFDANGRALSADFGRHLLEWDVGPRATSPLAFTHGSAVGHVGFEDDGTLRTLSIADGLRRWSPAADGPDPGGTAAVGGWQMAAVSPDVLAWCTAEGLLTVRRDGRETEIPLADGLMISDMKPSPDRSQLAITHTRAGLIVISISPSTNELRRFDAGGDIWQAAWLDDRTLLLAGAGMGLTALDVVTGRQRVIHEDRSFTATAVLDDRRVLVGTYDGEIVELDPATGLERRRIAGHGRRIRAIAVRPGGDRVATADDAGVISIRDSRDGQELLRIAGEGITPAMSLAWSPDGRGLAAGFGDGTVRLWANGSPWIPAREEPPGDAGG